MQRPVMNNYLGQKRSPRRRNNKKIILARRLLKNIAPPRRLGAEAATLVKKIKQSDVQEPAPQPSFT